MRKDDRVYECFLPSFRALAKDQGSWAPIRLEVSGDTPVAQNIKPLLP